MQSIAIGMSGGWPAPQIVACAQEAERCGSAEECCAGLLALPEAGLRTVALYSVLGRDPIQAIRLNATAVVPHRVA